MSQSPGAHNRTPLPPLTMVKHIPAHAPVLQHALGGARAARPQRAQAHVTQGDVPAAAAAAAAGPAAAAAVAAGAVGNQGIDLGLHVKEQVYVGIWGGRGGGKE